MDTLEYKPDPRANHIGPKTSVKDGYWGARDAFAGAPEPIIFGISSPGLEADESTKLLKGDPILDGRSVWLGWQKYAKNGSIIVQSQLGDARPIAVVRPVTRTAVLTYETSTQQWIPANWTTTQVTTDDRDGMKANGRSPTSPDGKWWASDKTATLQAGPNERLVNASFNYVSGAGALSGPHGLSYNANASQVTATVRCWSGPVTYELRAQIERLVNVQQQHTTNLTLKGNPFTINVPNRAIHPKFALAYRNLLLGVDIGSHMAETLRTQGI